MRAATGAFVSRQWRVSGTVVAPARLEQIVVVVDDVAQPGNRRVVIEAALIDRTQTDRVSRRIVVRPQAGERRRSIAAIRGAIGLERVDADFARRMQVPPWFGPQRFDVAGAAFRLAAEQFVAALRRRGTEAAGGRAIDARVRPHDLPLSGSLSSPVS